MRQCLIARVVLSVVTLVMARPETTPLVTNGRWIVNSTDGRRVRLRCANWYGAHQELHVVGGLELRSVAELTSLFRASGANCVRLPFSVELAKYNPLVPAEAIAGILSSDGCNSTRRALDVMDCVVAHLQRRGILVVLNSHNSRARWVGAGALEQQGLWHVPGYSTEDWLQSLETMARRYKVAGMDLRNEIHDQDGVRITWGETDDVETDWLAASTAAYDRLHQVDPDLLVIVGGLCWNTDLRPMMANVGPLRALQNRKLVYTAHIYSFSFWWHDQPLVRAARSPLLVCLSLACLAASLACLYKAGAAQRNKKTSSPHMLLEFEWRYSQLDERAGWTAEWRGAIHTWPDALFAPVCTSVVFSGGWLALAVLYYTTAAGAGCSSFAKDAVWLIVIALQAATVALCVGLVRACSGRELPWLLVTAHSLLWMGLFSVSLYGVGTYLDSPAAYTDALAAWSLDNRSVPVWVGEFGTGHPDEPVFRLLWDFIRGRHDLDFAYWAFNGRKWWEGAWESEGFGLVDDQYSGWRFPEFVRSMFG